MKFTEVIHEKQIIQFKFEFSFPLEFSEDWFEYKCSLNSLIACFQRWSLT